MRFAKFAAADVLGICRISALCTHIRLRALLALLFAIGVWLPARTAFAQATLHASSSVVEVGSPVEISLEVLGPDDSPPVRPTFVMPTGLTVLRQSVGTTQRVQFGANGASRRMGIQMTWIVSARTPGDYTIGPVDALIGSRKTRSNGVRIHVVAVGKGPQRAPAATDPWGSLFPGLVEEEPEPEPEVTPTESKFALPAARAPLVFLHAKLDRTSAVVGEQVVLDVYAYEENGIADLRYTDTHEVPAPDFVRRVLSPNEADVVGRVRIGDKGYSVRLLRKVALFPLKAGKLETGAMSVAFSGKSSLVTRESESLVLNVTEPPLEGRPPGYQAGTTGNFNLKCNISKATLVAGDATAVTVTLQGTGNFPSSLKPPLAEGVIFLAPEVRETTTADARDRISGEQVLTYVVRVEKTGDIALGKFQLPYYDPEHKRYDVTSCDLGVVHTTPSSRPVAVKADHPLKSLGAPATGAALPAARRKWLESSTTFAAMTFSPPVAALVGCSLWAFGRNLIRRRKANVDSAQSRYQRAKDTFRGRLRGSDERATLGALRELLVLAVEVRCGPGLRAVAEAELVTWLVERGLSLGMATQLERMLAELDTLRFAGGAQAEASANTLVQAGDKLAREVAGG
jgi:BatD DUF11 like domain